MQSDIQKVIESVSNTSGNDFFNAITLALQNTISADYTFIAVIDKEEFTGKTVALVYKGEVIENFEYSLSNTPCANVAGDSTCYYPHNVCAAFPNDQLLVDMKIDAYLGIPLHNDKQHVIGLVVALYENPIEDDGSILSLFQVFSGRIAAEIERCEYEHIIRKENSF